MIDVMPTAARCILPAAVAAVAACGASPASTTPAVSRAPATPAMAVAPATPAVSAAAACRDFKVWYITGPGLGGPADHGTVMVLRQAAAEAPTGELYENLGTLLSAEQSAAAATGSLAQSESDLAIIAASAVEQDCQAVNPS